MRNTKILSVMLIMALVFGATALSLTGCDTGSGGGGGGSAPPSSPKLPVTPIDTPITSVSIIITAPVKAMVPAATATGTGDFTIGAVTWSPTDNPFNSEVSYTASVTLTAGKGFTFTGLTDAKINGQKTDISDNKGASVILTHTFPKTDARTGTGISISSQPGKLSYSHGDTINLSGLVIQMSFDIGDPEVVPYADFASKNITVSPANGDTLSVAANNSKPVTITYGNKTANTSNLTVNRINPVLADFTISGTGTYTIYESILVTVTANHGKTTGTATVKYNGSTTAPSAVGTYTVTFDVAADTNYNAVTGLSAGTLVIKDYFDSVAAFKAWLDKQPTNTTTTAYSVKLNISSLTTDLRTALINNPNKYVYLDLSGSTIKTIPDRAFCDTTTTPYTGCTTLTGITIPNSVTTIGNSAFAGCTGLTSVTIPNSVTRIGDVAFSGCTSLTSVTIPTGVTYIGSATFSSCTSLTSVTIPNSVTRIDSAFANCTSLTSVTIPNSVTHIDGAFNYCTSLTSVTFATGSKVTSIGWYTFRYCTSLTSVTIPNSVTSIGNGAFSYCTSLTSVTIPNSVTDIDSAFANCTSLTAINVDTANTAYSSDNGVLYNKNKTSLYTYPAGKTAASFTIPNSVTRIESGAFWGCTSLTSVTIPNSVTNIEQSAFSGCASLASVTIPNSVTNIEQWAFSGCASLASVTFTPTSKVINIWRGAFSSCTSLTSVTIPASVTGISNEVFSNCNNLTSVTFATGSNITSANFGERAFPEGSSGDGGNTLKTAYNTGKAGTYTRASGGTTWTKQ